MNPDPDYLSQLPIWRNYVTAQLSAAALGLIPRNAVALGVTVNDYLITIHCQLRELTEQDRDDLDEIVSELGILLEDENAQLSWVHDIRERAFISPHDGVLWVFCARD